MTTTAREIYLKFRPSGSPSSITLDTDEVSQIGTFRSIIYRDIIVPLTYFSISAINNTFLFRENNVGAWTKVTLTPGNYTSSQFGAEVKARLEDAGAGTYTVTVDGETGFITIAVAGGAATFSISFTTGDRQKEKIWGIVAGTTGAGAGVENPPTAAQINNVLAVNYTSTNSLPSVIVINSRNNQFGLFLETFLSWQFLTLTNGTYTRESFASMLNTVFLANIALAVLTATITNTGKLRLVLTPAAGLNTFSIAFLEKQAETEQIWGVPYGTAGAKPFMQNPPNAAQINNVASYTSSCPIILWGPDQLSLKSSALEKMTTVKNTEVNTRNQNIITKLPIVNNTMNQQVTSSTFVRTTVANTTFPKTVDLDLTDEDGNSLDLNGSNCYINIIVI